MLTSFLVYLLWTTPLKADGEKPQVNNAWRCNRGKDPKWQNDCRKNRAANLWCRDKLQCAYNEDAAMMVTHTHPQTGQPIQVFSCSDHDAARRVGMTCNDFPFYNGGYPILAGGVDWDEEWENYKCAVDNGRFCLEWSSHEDSPGEYEVGTYNCTETAVTEGSGVEYCRKWESEQKETKKCSEGTHRCTPDCGKPTYCYKQCCSDNGCYDCSYAPETEWEYSQAECTKVNNLGACLEWKQEEFDHHNFHFREYEIYQCIELSSNENYCHRWVGDIDSEEEFEISTCQCLDNDRNDSSFCHEWTCYETGYNYFFPNMVWVLLPICVCGVFVFFAICCLMDPLKGHEIPNPDFIILLSCHVIFALGLTIVAAHLAGFTAVLISVGSVFILFPALVYYMWRSYHKDDSFRLECGWENRKRVAGAPWGEHPDIPKDSEAEISVSRDCDEPAWNEHPDIPKDSEAEIPVSRDCNVPAWKFSAWSP